MNQPEWEYRGAKVWVFGIKIRGLVRNVISEVWYDTDYETFYWRYKVYRHKIVQLPDGRNIRTRDNKSGGCRTFDEAIQEAESVLGIFSKEVEDYDEQYLY